MKLNAENVTCVRGGRTVFSGLSFSLGAGECMALTGPNGAGKSSLLRCVAGLVEPVEGEITLEGADPELTVGQSAHYVGHLNAIKTAMSVRENIGFWTKFLGTSDTGADLETFGLDAHGTIPAALLSSGQGRRLALSRLVAVARPLWLLDEPTVGLDAASQEVLVGVMKDHLASGGLLIAATHTELGIDFDHRLELAGRTPQ